MEQSSYLNGLPDGINIHTSPLLVFMGNAIIDNNPTFVPLEGTNVFQGYIDKLTVSRRPKSACEILEEATLAARFPFDNATILVDFEPNAVSANASSYSILTNGHSLQAIGFNGSMSYFQTWGFTQFSINNQPFSISLWIQPQHRSGTLVHMSTLSTGLDAWCLPFIGLSSNGALAAQISNGTTILSVIAPDFIPLSTPSWTHIVQTWSSTNGRNLYVNNIVVDSQSSITTFAASGITPNYVTLANSLLGSGSFGVGAINSSNSFIGSVDDFRIYSRELSAVDVCALYLG
ncbi:unnamed protein product [Rotaria magnacalcarata]|uniref:LamG domain-containing protein n=1 Tax=Rotaria magnacalcarata TaxID=392030 RepID=A0A816M7R7_9BILA|nr:unnamed protein product [Rotaria magnacalcarata]CAF4174492.1 unnamed protein product [Rotaria magnacalcarata]